jgi:hypothetical protein
VFGSRIVGIYDITITVDDASKTEFWGYLEGGGITEKFFVTGKVIKSNNRFGATVWNENRKTVAFYLNGYVDGTLISGQVTDANDKYLCEFSFKSQKK